MLQAGPYVYSSAENAPVSQLTLLSALQGNNNARAVLSSGMDMFSNALYHLSKGVNQQYVRDHVIAYAG